MILNPEAQLAAASGQLQQDATASFYNPPGYASGVQETATALTMGLTNVALPGMGLMSSIGLTAASSTQERRIASMLADPTSRLARLTKSNPQAAKLMQQRMRAQGLDPFAMMKAGARGGSRAGSLVGAGRLGGFMGGAGGLAAGFMLPMAVGEVYTAAADQMIQGQREFLANRQTLQQLPMQSPFGAASVLGGQTSMNMDPMSVQRFGSSLANIGSQYGASTSQMRNITSALGGMGAVDTRSVSAASASIRSAMQELQQIGRQIDGDLQAAVQTYQQLKAMGFDSTRQRMQALRGMSSTSSLTGMSLGRVQGMTTATMQAAQQVGMSAGQGFNIGLDSLNNSALRSSQGLINPSYLNRVGGVEGYASRMAELQIGVIGSQGMDAMMSRLYEAGGGSRASGLDGLTRGHQLSARGSFFSNVDPYEMARMRSEMSYQANGLILSGVQGIRDRFGDDPTRANREQYRFMASMGIQDPQEQLEYLSNLRSQPRAQALRIGQQFRDSSIAAQGQVDDPMALSRRFSDAINELTRSAIGGAEEFRRFGAHLQVRAEQAVNQAYNSALGGTRGIESGNFTNDAIDAARGRFLRGEISMGGNSLAVLERQLNTDASLQNALANYAGIQGRVGMTGGMGQGYLSRQIFGASRMMANFTGSGQTGRGSFADAFGGVTGVSGSAGAGINVGIGASGATEFASGAEFLQMAALQQGGFLNPETLRIERASQAAIDDILSGPGLGRAESALLDQLRPRNSGLLGGLGFSMDQASQHTVGLDRNIQLSETELREIRQNPGVYLDRFARSRGARNFADLSPGDQSSLLAALQQGGGQIGNAVAAGMGMQVQTSMNENSLASSVFQSGASGSLGAAILGSRTQRFQDREGTFDELSGLLGVDPARLSRNLRRGNLGTGDPWGMSYGGSDFAMSFDGYYDESGTLRQGSIRNARLTGSQLERLMVANGANAQAARIEQYNARNSTSDAFLMNLNEESQGLLRQGRGRQAIGNLLGTRRLGEALYGDGDASEMIRSFITGGSGFGETSSEQRAALQRFLGGFRGTGREEGLETLISGFDSSGLGEAEAARLQMLQDMTSGGRLPSAGTDIAELIPAAQLLANRPSAQFNALVGSARNFMVEAENEGGRAIYRETAGFALDGARLQAAQGIIRSGNFDVTDEEARALASGSMTQAQAQGVIDRARDLGTEVDDPVARAFLQSGGDNVETLQGVFSSIFDDSGRITESGLAVATSLPGSEFVSALNAAQRGLGEGQLAQLHESVQTQLQDLFGVDSIEEVARSIRDNGFTTAQQETLGDQFLPFFALGSTDTGAIQERQFDEQRRNVFRRLSTMLDGGAIIVRAEQDGTNSVLAPPQE